MGKVKDYIDSLPFDAEYHRLFGHRPALGHIYCPFHSNTDTPAAKYYPDSNCCYCFVCRRTYGTYDLLMKYDPDRVNEIKQSVIIEDNPQASRASKGSIFVNINRDDSIEKIIKDIIDGTGV